jgi:fibronectin type 3 domain-containing protein
MNRHYRRLSPLTINLLTLLLCLGIPGILAAQTPVAAYSFNENTGTTVNDSSGNAFNGTTHGTTWTASGKYGAALSFNGTSSYVDLGAPAPLLSTGTMSWEAWTSVASFVGSGGQIIALADNTLGWELKTSHDTGAWTFAAAVSNGTTHVQRYSNTVPALNTFYHVAGVYNATTQTLDIYVNGVLDDGILRNGPVPASDVMPTGVNATVGRRGGTYAAFYNGIIDEVRVYTTALTQAQIQSDMNTPIGAVAPPTAPTNVTANAISTSQINLSWTASTSSVGIKNYVVQRCQGAACSNFAPIGAPTTTTTFNDTGLTPSTSYSYEVNAVDTQNTSGANSTPPATATTLSVVQPPTAPSNVTANAISTTQINLSWTASTSSVGIKNYVVQRCQGAGCSNFGPIGSPTTTTFNDTGLTPSTSYSYEVNAVDTQNTSGTNSTPPATATTSAGPTAPTNVTATAISSTQINLSWTAPNSSLGIKNYVVQRCQGAACSNFATIASPTTTTYSDTPLTAGTSYSYQVSAVDNQSNSGPNSTSASATTFPTAPTNVTATAISSSQINVSWTASSSSIGIKNYVVQRCQGAACSNFAPIATPTAATFSDTGLTAGTSYSYQVSALDTQNNSSANSTPAATATTSTPPTVPTNVTANAISTSQINVSWTASTSSVGLKNYVVQRCQGAACSNFATVATPTTNTLNDTGLTPGTSYSYEVSALDTQNNSSANSTPPATATTSGNATAGLAAAYGFNEGSGTSTADSSGNGFTGTLNGATWTTAGKYGNALSFDGVTSFVDLGTPAPLLSTGTMSWEAWTSVASFVGSGGQIIALADNTLGWELKTSHDTGAWTFAVAVSNGTTHIQRYSNTAPALNTFYHVAGVYNATAQTLDIYVNGVLDDGILRNGTVPSSDAMPTGVHAMVGRRGGTYAAFYNGTIDEVRVYTTALTQAQIQSDMNTPLGGGSVPPTGTVSPTGLTFVNQTVGTSSNAQTVTLTNTGGGTLSISPATITTTSGPVAYTYTTDCGTTLASNVSCHYNVVFSPPSSGSFPATLNVIDNTSASPHMVSLSGTGVASTGTISISPRSTPLTFTRTQQFTVANAGSGGVTWSVDGVTGGASSTGTISSTGMYTPPSATGTHTVTVTSSAGSANATVYVVNYPGMFTRDVDNLRTGLNPNETVLTTANVNSTSFGKLLSYSIDGFSNATPLYVANLAGIAGGTHNVVYVATEHDSVYAFDADGLQSTPLWHVSFINPPAVTTVPYTDVGNCNPCGQPEVGITGTPVIDPSTKTMYVVAMTKESGSHVHRVHALDITTGAEKFGGPFVITASVPGSGAPQSGGQVTFNSLRQNQRAAALLSNGVVYFAFASHQDITPYHGWVLGYDAATLQQTVIFNDSPNTSSFGAGIWQSGDGVATDTSGNLYFSTGNGVFDANTGGKDYGDSLLRVNQATNQTTGTGGVVDYFTPHDQANMNANDLDLGSGGVILLPDAAGSTAHPHLVLTAGKNGTVYLVDRDKMGGYQQGPNGSDNIVQSVVNVFPNNSTAGTGNFKAPVYWNGSVFYSSDADVLRAFSISNAHLSTSPTSVSSTVFNYPGSTLGVSSNGNTNGILWSIQRVDHDQSGQGTRGPGSLHAYDGTNLANELYNSNQASGSRDVLDFACKWSAPVVANGKVYVATESLLSIFGLLP